MNAFRRLASKEGSKGPPHVPTSSNMSQFYETIIGCVAAGYTVLSVKETKLKILFSRYYPIEG